MINDDIPKAMESLIAGPFGVNRELTITPLELHTFFVSVCACVLSLQNHV